MAESQRQSISALLLDLFELYDVRFVGSGLNSDGESESILKITVL
jgi:hypothetical protein